MRLRTIMFGSLCASFALASVGPASADDDWRRREWQEHRRHEWLEHERREQEWRERQSYYGPPVVAPPGYGYYAPPPVYYVNPGAGGFGFPVR